MKESGARIRADAGTAFGVAQDSLGQPTGELRVACPVAMAAALLACAPGAVAPCLRSDNLQVLREAVLAGWGVAPMAMLMCAEDLAACRPQIVALGWAPPPAQLNAVHGLRRSLSVAGRAFIGEFEGFLREVYRVGWGVREAG